MSQIAEYWGPGAPLRARTAGSLVRAVVAAVAQHGTLRYSDGGLEVQELLAVNTVLADPRARLLRSTSHPEIFNPGLAVARFFYLISGSHDLDTITFYSPAARRFSDDGLTMPGGAHGFRLFYPASSTDQFEGVVRTLTQYPERNRAAVSFYHPEDCGSPTVDLTCVMGAMFTCKANRLQTLVNMRANDALRLLWYDLFEFSMLGEYVASYCGLELGEYYHSSFVMMLIGRSSLDSVDDVIAEDDDSPRMGPMPRVDADTRRHLVKTERAIRAALPGQSFDEFHGMLDRIRQEQHPYWADLFVALALQGRYVHLDAQAALSELSLLQIPEEFTVACETRDSSVRLSLRRQKMASGPSRLA